VDFTTAAVILAEIGLDMSRFADAAHLASWAGLCPGNNESGGKRFSGSTRKGNRYLRRVLTQSAWSLKRKKDCYLSALFWRVSSRGGSKKAALAVAHRILVIAYQVIRDGTVYEELGGNHYDCLHRDRSARRLIRRLEQIGFAVAVEQTRPESTPAVEANNSCLSQATQPRNSKGQGSRAEEESSADHAERKPADASLCPRCARWGILCIHARNAKLLRAPTTHP
jgi:hypothetical protein